MHMRFFPRPALGRLARPVASGMLLLLAGIAGCRDLRGDNFSETGAVEVLVQDQAGAPLFDVTVTIDRVNDVLTERTANNGVVRFDLVEAGERTYTVRDPDGYTGGGAANSKTVTVLVGLVTKSTFTLTKLSAAGAN